MPYLLVRFSDPSQVDVSAVVGELSKTVEGLTVTSEDAYADRRRKTVEVIENCGREGRPLNNPDVVLGSLDAAAAKAKHAMRISIPLADGELSGNVSTTGMLLSTQGSLKGPNVQKLTATLKSMETVSEMEMSGGAK